MNPRSLTAIVILSTVIFIAFSSRYMRLDLFASPKTTSQELITSTVSSTLHTTAIDARREKSRVELAAAVDYLGIDSSEEYLDYDSEEQEESKPKKNLSPRGKGSPHVSLARRERPNVKLMDPKMRELQEIHKQRRELVKSVCIRNSVYPTPHNIVPEKFHHIHVNDEYKFLYCSIPKVACTNWKRVLLVLSGKVNTTNPMSLTPREAHSPEMAKYMTTLDMYSKKEVQYRLKNYFKFVFVRDPLERVLSAYNNKFTVPYNDYFPQRFGRQIIKKFRKNASKKALKTGRNVKFPEFVKYILDPETPRPFNVHWREYYKLCYPCLIQYDAVGKYDTFDDDIDYVMNVTGISDVIKFPRANRLKNRPRTSNVLEGSYANISSVDIHKLWETYSVDYAMFGYPYPDLKPH